MGVTHLNVQCAQAFEEIDTDQNIEIATLGSLPVVLIGPVEISVGLE